MPASVASPAGTYQRPSHSRISALLRNRVSPSRGNRTGAAPRKGRTLPRMANAQHTPVVPLEAGAGPENPPCPACGEPLFGWLSERPGLRGPVRRCESCGLGVVGAPGDPEEALRELGQDGPRIANRASFAASLGSAGWAGLEPGSHYLFTVESVRRLVAQRDQVVRRRRWTAGPSFLITWQTFLNS